MNVALQTLWQVPYTRIILKEMCIGKLKDYKGEEMVEPFIESLKEFYGEIFLNHEYTQRIPVADCKPIRLELFKLYYANQNF